MTRAELLNDVRRALNRLAVEVVESDDLAAAQSILAASILCGEARGHLEEAETDEEQTRAAHAAEE